MKRRILALATASVVFLAPTTAQAQDLTINLDGAPITDLGTALDAITRATTEISSTGATFSAAGYSVVYDPRSLENYDPEQAEPEVPVVQQEGVDAEGRKVVLPAVGRFTSGYGARWGATHQGVDIAAPIGAPIRAVMDGTVVNAGPASGFGQWVVLEHSNGERSVYGHVSSFNVSVGQQVAAGDVIAAVGNEGQSTGPHLHFEIKPDGSTPVDPQPWFAERGIIIG